MLCDKFYISASLYFRIHDAEVYGGDGSVGYFSVTYHGCENPEALDEKAAEAARARTAELFGKTPDKVEIIDKNVYDYETGGEDEEDDEDDAYPPFWD